MKGRDIVVIGIQPWDTEIGSNCKDIATEMAKNNRVLYVNIPITRMTAIRDKNHPAVKKRLQVVKGKTDSLTKISHNLWEFNPPILINPINKIKPNFVFDFFNRRDSKKFANEIKKLTKKLEFENYIVFNDSSMFLGYYLDEFLDYDSYIYYIRDNLINSRDAYWHTHGPRIEKEIIKKVDLTVTNSIYYTNYAKEFSPNSFMIGQGCDTSLFNDTLQEISPASDLQNIQNPIIGYVGYITTKRMDINLIKDIATMRPHWSIVLVGPEDDGFKNSALHSIANIHFFGSRNAAQLPSYIKGFDVCINPQIVNYATIGNYPRKVDEYLAMGKPVVATKTEAMEYFAEHTYLGETSDDYIQLIDKAISENTKALEDKRRAFAMNHSWEQNVKDIFKCLEEVKK